MFPSLRAIHGFPQAGEAGRHMVGQARGSARLYHICTRRLVQLDKYYLAQIFSGNYGWGLTEAKSKRANIDPQQPVLNFHSAHWDLNSFRRHIETIQVFAHFRLTRLCSTGDANCQNIWATMPPMISPKGQLARLPFPWRMAAAEVQVRRWCWWRIPAEKILVKNGTSGLRLLQTSPTSHPPLHHQTKLLSLVRWLDLVASWKLRRCIFHALQISSKHGKFTPVFNWPESEFSKTWWQPCWKFFLWYCSKMWKSVIFSL